MRVLSNLPLKLIESQSFLHSVVTLARKFAGVKTRAGPVPIAGGDIHLPSKLLCS